MKSKFLSLSLAIVVCFSLLIVPTAAQGYPEWSSAALERWEACGMLDTGTDVAAPLTRIEMTALFNRVTATDLTPLERPEDPATRQELAVLTAKVFGLSGGEAAVYSDAASIAPWAADAVATLQRSGVMVGSGGNFRPDDTATYAETVKTISNAIALTGPITGLTVRARAAEGVLADGEPAQVNDGKYEVSSLKKTEGGYVLTVQGLAPLVGQEANADGIGQPEYAGKWMGLQFQFHGLIRADEVQYSTDGVIWKKAGLSDTFAENVRNSSFMIFLNGTKETSAQGEEASREVTVQFRVGEAGNSFNVQISYVPAQ